MPMILQIDNEKGAASWDATQLEHEQKRSHYDSIRQTFLHELNDEGII
jgi:hypothetical protein